MLSAPTPVTGDSSVITEGTEVWGGSGGGESNGNTSFTLENGVSFGLFSNSITCLSGFDRAVEQDGQRYENQAADNIPDLGFSDPGLNGALSYGPVTAPDGALFLNIRGLTRGDTYIIQAFADMTHTGNSNGNGGLSGTEIVTPGSGPFSGLVSADATTLTWGQTADPANPGSYLNSGAYSITDTFVANDAGTAFLLFGNSPGSAYELLDAVQIRVVPEPSTYAMMLGGLALLGLWHSPQDCTHRVDRRKKLVKENLPPLSPGGIETAPRLGLSGVAEACAASMLMGHGLLNLLS